MAQLLSPPPLWGRVGWGVGRFYAKVDARKRSSTVKQNLSTPTPAPPHKGEGKKLIRRRRGRRHTFGLTDHGDQEAAIEQPLGDASRVVQRDAFDHRRPPRDVIDAEIVALQLHQ